MAAVSSNSGAMQTYAPACIDMISLFTSCTSKINGFTTLAFEEQASCYCCRTALRSVAWTDELDSYASTCADWAVTGEPDTAYSVAKTFETFCERFTDVCDASGTVSEISTTTDESVSTATDNSSSNRGGIVTITHMIVEMTGPAALKSDPPSPKGGLSTRAIAGIAIGAGLVALLALCGVFLWCWKTKRSSQNQTTVQQIQPTQQEQPVVYMPYGQQSPVYGSPPPFSPVYPSNAGYQTSSLPPPQGQTQFVAELSAAKQPIEAVEAGGTEIRR
ncbi:hypothetical protein BKA59DRAFT_546981 [Fusarium tricinctum]|uniref:Uncharacterized protein n=1 Tax=Fusarium tricinctum TaxID=61284 RepID=A0A8K0WBD2_9HYPO|nr:hypothetical protein BKA59DRAFT_546981 [Fusarium tricinctum]